MQLAQSYTYYMVTLPAMSLEPTSVLGFLRQYAPYADMESDALQYLAEHLETMDMRRGEELIAAQETPSALYIVQAGSVSAESANDRERAYAPGDCFPLTALMAHRPAARHSAASDGALLILARTDFEALLERSPVFSRYCTEKTNPRVQSLRGIQAGSANRLSDARSLNSPVRSLVSRTPVTCAPALPLRQALRTMHEQQVGSIVVLDDLQRPQGILTLHDVLSRVALQELSLDTPVEAVMSPDVLSVAPEDSAHQAAMLMARHALGHLGVTDARGRLVGVVSERDIFSLQRVGVVSLARAIAQAADVPTLAELAEQTHRLVDQMLAQGATVHQLTQLTTELNDNVTQRVIALELERNPPPVPITWLAFGSEGRREQTLKTDQDNGIVFELEDDADAAAVRESLLPIAQRINQALAQCGFPLCPGNIMAGNPECCLSLQEWREKFGRWIDQGTPEHLLKASIFFDFRPLYGDPAPAERLRQWLAPQVERNSRFRRQMAATALNNRPPLGLLGDFRVASGRDKHPGTVDLKIHGVTLFVDGARLLALANRVTETNTVARLRGACEAGALSQDDTDSWIGAYEYIQLLRMRAHQRQAERNEPLSNHFDPDSLNSLDRRVLKEAFRAARALQSKLALEYQL